MPPEFDKKEIYCLKIARLKDFFQASNKPIVALASKKNTADHSMSISLIEDL